MNYNNYYDIAVEFTVCTEIAEEEFNKGNKTTAAYWIGQATVYEQIIDYSLNMVDKLIFDHRDLYSKWIILRAKSNH